MKKPNITEGEWDVSKFETNKRVGVKVYGGLALKVVCKFDGLNDWEVNAKAIAQVPNMIDDIMCMYYHFLGQWESVKDHPSSNYGRDAFSLYETLVNAGCEPEKEETERFRKAGYVE